MIPLVRRLRRQAGRGLHRIHGLLRGFRGHVDGYRDGALIGWVVPRDMALHPVRVGVFSSRGLITQGVANMNRPDLAQAGISTGPAAQEHGFVIPLDRTTLDMIRSNGGKVRVRTLSDPAFEVGTFDFNAQGKTLAGPTQAGHAGDELAQLLFGSVAQLQALHEKGANPVGPVNPGSVPAPAGRYTALFGTKDYINGGTLPGMMIGYTEYLRFRDKLETRFDPSADPVAIEHFFKWYLGHYSTNRGGLRVPMTKVMLDYLNTPVTVIGQKASFTRATWAFLVDVPQIVQLMNFNNPDWVDWVLYWWSVDHAKALNVEDCLVPQAYIDRLAAIPDSWAGSAFALSEFMVRIHRQTTQLATLNMNQLKDRRRLVLALMMMAVQRPDYLRYMPHDAVDALLAPDRNGASAFAQFYQDMAATGAAQAQEPPLTRTDYAAVLRLRGFDLDSRSFVTFLPDGNRVEMAMLPPVTGDAAVDLQLIGPFEKASGLGQATRLSAQVIAELGGLSVNCVNFGLDNPAPEGFSRVGTLGDYKPAKINLIHLNAESIPLAYAYLPDVFSGAYNIGYFFWELNTPAACHYLGMEMLDEIWVSTDYGVQIYQPEFKGPVSNVGMCFEDLPDIDRRDARDYVQELFGFDDRTFVFLVVFDSFSFVQRKNPVGSVKGFIAAFKGVRDVRLVIKTQNRRKVGDPVQIAIWAQVDKLIKSDRRIVVLDETLSYGDLLRLKKGCDAYVSLHKSEGWGFGMIEAMNLGVPVVCTGYSGNMDFCSDDTAFLVGYTEVDLGPDDYIFVRPGQKWAEPDVADAARQMRLVYDNPDLRRAKAAAALAHVRQNFSVAAIAQRYAARLHDILKSR